MAKTVTRNRTRSVVAAPQEENPVIAAMRSQQVTSRAIQGQYMEPVEPTKLSDVLRIIVDGIALQPGEKAIALAFIDAMEEDPNEPEYEDEDEVIEDHSPGTDVVIQPQ